MRQDIQKHTLAELSSDCQKLVALHMPLAYAMAWKLRDCGISLDDLQQEGMLGLCEAALRYDENTDCSFATYATYWCRKMMLMTIRHHRETGSQPIEQCTEPEDEDLLRIGQQQRIDDALRYLSHQEQQFVRYFYGIGTNRLSLMETASAMGISKARASVIHSKALKKLEAALTKHPLVDYLSLWLK